MTSDRPPTSSAPGGSAYIICTAPRSGSSLLAHALWRTERAGHPAEYFDIHERNQTFWMNKFGIDRADLFLGKALEAGRTSNGLFGLKLHWHQIPALFESVQAARGPDDPRPPHTALERCLDELFADTRYMWLRRRNTIAQGISYYLASETDVWGVRRNADVPSSADHAVPFDLAAIDRHVKLVESFDRAWEDFFTRTRRQALVLVYEDFVQAQHQTVRAICEYLGVGGRDIDLEEPGFRKQGDDRSLEWERQYRQLKGLGETERPRLDRPAVRVTSNRPVARPRPPARSRENDGVADESNERLLIAYDMNAQLGVELAPASARRAWMDESPQRFAYRCLPLVIANQNGWVFQCPHRVEAIWNGGPRLEDLQVRLEGGGGGVLASSHFGSGVLTFSVGYLIRTPPGINLHVRGPANLPKDGICALEGIVETDWSEATFTMNWKMTRPNHPVVFEKGEPFAMISPMRRGEVESFKPEIRLLSANSALDKGYRTWARSRADFNARLKNRDPEAQKMSWQKHYLRGETVGHRKAVDHQTGLIIRPFDDCRWREPSE